MELRIVTCQLGLFGYAPRKRIVEAAPEVDAALKAAIERNLEEGRLSCRAAWSIAEELGIARMAVSSACETLGIKLSGCQLGAF